MSDFEIQGQNKKRGFTKVDNEFVRCRGVSHTAFRLFILLRSFSNGRIYPSYQAINRYTGLASDTVTSGLEELRSFNMISYVRGSSSRANRYSILPEEEWQLPQNLGNTTTKRTPLNEDVVPNFQRPVTQKTECYAPQTVGSNNTNTDKTKVVKTKEKEDGFDLLSTEQLTILRTAMSKSGYEAVTATSAAVTKVFRRVGENKAAFGKVERLIDQQFCRNEQTQKLGLSVLMAAKAAYKDAVQSHSLDKFAIGRERQLLEEKEKRDNCPTKTDAKCRKIIHLLGTKCCDTGRGPWEFDVSDEELQYFLDCNVEYWGENKARSAYSAIFAYLERETDLIEDEDEIEDEDDDEDDDEEITPTRLKKSSKPESRSHIRHGRTE